jgi:hypothetical protein
VVTVGGDEVFREEWDATPLAAELPAGWENPYADTPAAGTWQMSSHGALIQTANFAPATTGTGANPKADADSSVFVGPPAAARAYYLELGIHPFDNDGIGFVYDFEDTNNFARVLFVSEATADGRVPQGVSVSRKRAGAWTDVLAGDGSFVYTPGRPFEVEFTRGATSSHMTVVDGDLP